MRSYPKQGQHGIPNWLYLGISGYTANIATKNCHIPGYKTNRAAKNAHISGYNAQAGNQKLSYLGMNFPFLCERCLPGYRGKRERTGGCQVVSYWLIFSYTRRFVFAAYRFWKNSKNTLRFAEQSLVRKGESSY